MLLNVTLEPQESAQDEGPGWGQRLGPPSGSKSLQATPQGCQGMVHGPFGVFLSLPSPVRVVEVTGVTDDAEGVVEVVLDDAPARAVRECALQVLRSFANTGQSPGHKKSNKKKNETHEK